MGLHKVPHLPEVFMFCRSFKTLGFSSSVIILTVISTPFSNKYTRVASGGLDSSASSLGAGTPCFLCAVKGAGHIVQPFVCIRCDKFF